MISIIIPTLNEEGCLDRTLETLTRGLTRTPHEIIISDGGSTDGTIAIAERYTAEVVRAAEGMRQTIGLGRNLGARAAGGDFLVFLDADVLLPHPDAFFADLLILFERDQQLVGVTVSLRVSAEQETAADRFWFGCVNLWHATMNNVLHRGSASGEFQMIRTTAFHTAGGYREDLIACEDIDLFARLARSGHTRMHRALTAFHSGRRAHRIGWLRLLLSWWTNALSLTIRGRSFSKEWTIVRSPVETEGCHGEPFVPQDKLREP